MHGKYMNKIQFDSTFRHGLSVSSGLLNNKQISKKSKVYSMATWQSVQVTYKAFVLIATVCGLVG